MPDGPQPALRVRPEHEGVVVVEDERSAFAVLEPQEPAFVRSPVTLIRLVGIVVALAIAYAVLRASSSSDFAASLAELLDSIPRWIVSGIVGVCQLGFLVPSMLGLVGQIALRRFARIGRMLLAAVICIGGLVALSKLAGTGALPLLPARPGHEGPNALLRTDYGIGASFPTTIDMGVITAWMFVDRAHWSGRWRLLGRLVVVMGIVAELGVSLARPAVILAAIVMGATAALVVQSLLGVPNTRPRGAVVGDILQRLGYQVASVERFGGFRGFAGFRVRLDDDRQLFVKIVNRESWAALFPVRLYRSARFRDMGQDRPFRSLRSIVEHEALCALKAHSDGVPTARLAVVTEFPPDAMMMAFDALPFRTLRDLEPERRTPQLLASVWAIVAALQRSHTVHRRLNADALLVDDEGGVALVEFSSASLGVVGPVLSTDVAEVLAATAVAIGVEPAVQAAVTGLGPAAVAAALPRLQPLALTSRTRSAIKAAGSLDELREVVQRATGTDATPIAELERIKLRTVASLAMAAVAIGTLVPQFLGLGSVWGVVRHANWWWAAAALGLSVITYFAAAVALDGSVPDRLPAAPNLAVQLATSYVGVAAPGGALALTTRFLQKQGIDTSTAVAAVGVDTLAGVIVHLTLTALFFGLAGSSGLRTFDLPSMTTLGLVLAGVGVVAAVGLIVPWSRSLITTRVLPATRRSLSSVGDLARQPSKMVELFGGSLLITMGYIFALAVSVSAFGAGPAFTSIALVYLVGVAVSSIAPTPGGIGAVEAALVAGLTSAGMPSTTALAAVILFRLSTFWLPLLPGWAAMVLLQRSGDL